MPRTKDSLNNSTYHYSVRYNNFFTGEVEEKLFRTSKEIEETFNLSKATIYNYYMGISKRKHKKNILSIEKLKEPVERFKRILVEFE